jgi:hypothetical protein
LLVAFWVFYVLGYFASAFLTIVVSPLFSTQPWRMLVVLILLVPYNVLSTMGVLRSADAYPLSRGWPMLAKVAVSLWEARIAWTTIKGFLRAIGEWGL